MSWSIEDYCPIVHKDLDGIVLENTKENHLYLYNVLGVYYTFQIDETDYKYIKIISDKHQDFENELTHFAISLPEEVYEKGFYFDLGGSKVVLANKITPIEEIYEMVKDSVSEISSLEYIKNGKNLKRSMNRVRVKTIEEFLSKPKLFKSRKKFSL